MENGPELEQVAKFLHVLSSETDRGLPLTAAAMLDEKICEILQTFLADNDESKRLLTGLMLR